MRTSLFGAVVLAAAAACSTTSSTSSGPAASAAEPARRTASDDPDAPSVLGVPADSVPAEVRAIEAQIDRRAVVMADEIRIEVSKNYEWDVALSGDLVSPQRPSGDGHESSAVGAARAVVRNLELRAGKIVFWRSGFGVAPFVRITARGNVAHVASDASGAPVLRRANLCAIRGADLYFDDEALTRGGGLPAAATGR
jgi:hypothetical protein